MDSWWNSVAQPAQWVALFDAMPAVYFYSKDAAHRFTRVNRATALMHGCAHPEEMVGKTDADFHPPAMAAQYVEEDRAVMESGQPLLERIWLVHDASGLPRWFLSNKFPLHDPMGTVVGIAGVMWAHDGTGTGGGAFTRLTPALDHVLRHYGEALSVETLAGLCHLSVSQLQREFQRCFGRTPTGYLAEVRLLMARWRLSHTESPLGQVAQECGYYDQSHFTRLFRRAHGLSPLAFRRSRGRPGLG